MSLLDWAERVQFPAGIYCAGAFQSVKSMSGLDFLRRIKHTPWHYVFPFSHAGNRKGKRCFLWKNWCRGRWSVCVCVCVSSVLKNICVYITVPPVFFATVLSGFVCPSQPTHINTLSVSGWSLRPHWLWCWRHSLRTLPNTNDSVSGRIKATGPFPLQANHIYYKMFAHLGLDWTWSDFGIQKINPKMYLLYDEEDKINLWLNTLSLGQLSNRRHNTDELRWNKMGQYKRIRTVNHWRSGRVGEQNKKGQHTSLRWART